MPRSWTQNNYHIVFSTKRREPTVSPEIESRLYPFIGGILKDLRCVSLAINGVPDHLHAMVRYPPHLSHSEMLKNVKGRSSRWLGENFSHCSWRGWQEGPRQVHGEPLAGAQG